MPGNYKGNASRLEGVDFNRRGEPTQLIVYRGKKDSGVYEDYTVSDEGKSNAYGHLFGEFLSKLEGKIVERADDPFYKVSSSVANRLCKDKMIGGVVALGIYCVLKEVGEEKK